jgi:hypothetical protein
MGISHLLNAIIKYKPAGKRNTGLPSKRLPDYHIETRVGHKTQVPESIMMMIYYNPVTFITTLLASTILGHPEWLLILIFTLVQ